MSELNGNLFNEASEQFVESSHKFVQPVRYFKSNDPYYWEVDNIPIKQLEENILFLRDQVANNLSISGIGREDLAELKPFVNGADRTVFVNPGRYTARINDAYNKGINLLNEVYANWNPPGGSGPPIDSGFANTATRKTKEFTLPLNVLKTLAGEIIDQPLLDTGLYTFLQHHNSEPLVGNTLEFSNSVDFRINSGLTVPGMPKSKAAIWRSFGHNYGITAFQNDLQQESVEFTRFWGGSIRTAIVDVAETLSISIPDFDENDYANTTDLTPATRIDLLFVYSHPIDSVSTTIMNPPGTPEQISAPRLGILKGAGVIALNQGHGNGVNNYDNEAGYFDTGAYATASGNSANYFTSENTVDLDILHNRMISTLADTQQTQIGLRGNFSNIPSPEDLLNLTPLFESQLSKDNLALVGQSVLPIAYVIVKRGQPIIVTNDLFDIRPFMRTAELSYNERAGVAAANPPLSFANPAVGKVEVQKDILDVRDVLMTEINKPNPISQPVAMGTIYGGTLWGPEGILTELEWAQWNDITDPEEKALGILKTYHVPSIVGELPRFPGWDINEEWFPGGGNHRNDRLFSAVKHNAEGKFNFPTNINEFDAEGNPLITDMPVSQFGYIGAATSHGRMCPMYGSLFVKKTFTFSQLLLQELGYTDFDVRVDLINCSLMAGAPSIDIGGNADIRTGAHQTGIFVEKNRDAAGGPLGFTIFVCVGSPAAHEGAPWFGQPDNSNNIVGHSYNRSQEEFFRKSHYFSRVGVITSKLIDAGATKTPNIAGARTTPQGTAMTFHGTSFDTFDDGVSGNQKQTFSPMLVTYPTVNFTIVGYKDDVPPYARKQVFSVNGEEADGTI